MNLIDMRPKDIYCLFEITYTDLKKLKTALDSTELQLDLADPKNREVEKYIKEVFYPVIVETIEGAEKNGAQS